MNYIKRLEAESANKDAQIKALSEGLKGLRSYMLSSKFNQDTTVQTGDILRWIDAIEGAQRDAEFGLV